MSVYDKVPQSTLSAVVPFQSVAQLHSLALLNSPRLFTNAFDAQVSVSVLCASVLVAQGFLFVCACALRNGGYWGAGC